MALPRSSSRARLDLISWLNRPLRAKFHRNSLANHRAVQRAKNQPLYRATDSLSALFAATLPNRVAAH